MTQIGDRVSVDEQLFFCVAVTNPQGNKSDKGAHGTWRAVCAEAGCGASFEQTFPPGYLAKEVRPNRRCPMHHRAGIAVDPRFNRGIHPDTDKAVDLLMGLIRDWAKDEVAMPLYAFLKHCTHNYSNMPENVAQKLGARAAPKSRSQYILRCLNIAIRRNLIYKSIDFENERVYVLEGDPVLAEMYQIRIKLT